MQTEPLHTGSYEKDIIKIHLCRWSFAKTNSTVVACSYSNIIMTSYFQKFCHIFRQVDFTLLLIVSVVVAADTSNLTQLTSEN